MRILLSAALLLVTASCVSQNNWSPISIFTGPGHLQLSNFRFDRAQIEAVVAAAPDCSAPTPLDGLRSAVQGHAGDRRAGR